MQHKFTVKQNVYFFFVNPQQAQVLEPLALEDLAVLVQQIQYLRLHYLVVLVQIQHQQPEGFLVDLGLHLDQVICNVL